VHEHILLGGLHQVLAALADRAHEAEHVHAALRLHLLQHGVQRDVGAGAAHARTAVHHKRVPVGRVGRVDVADEVQDAHGVGAGRVLVGPLRVVVLCDGEREVLAAVSCGAGRGQRGVVAIGTNKSNYQIHYQFDDENQSEKIFLEHFCNHLFIDISVNQLPFSRLLQSKVRPRIQNKLLKII